MARPATGSARWNPLGHWEARITLDGARQVVPMTEVPACSVAPASPAPLCACSSCALARQVAKVISDRARRDGAVPEDTAETVSEWYGRYYTWRAGKARGAESVSDSRGRFKKWIEPKLGTRAMVRVTREDLESLVAYLDDVVGEETIAAKTAANIWGEISAGFAVATRCKDKALRVLTSNPAEAVEGPDDGVKKQKPFLRPDEVTKLLACEGREGVPLERRHVYAVAIYTAMRQGELRAVRARDVDLDTMQITVVRQVKNGREKDRTKTGRARIVQVEPALVPLLRVLLTGREPDDRLLSVGAHNRCASHLREDLIAAGCTREALHVAKTDPMRARMKFHNLRDTCLTHMAVRRDPPQDVQWRAGHTTPAMTEQYIASARYVAGASFGTPLGELPPAVLKPLPPEGASEFRPGFGQEAEIDDLSIRNLVEAPGIEGKGPRVDNDAFGGSPVGRFSIRNAVRTTDRGGGGGNRDAVAGCAPFGRRATR